MKRKISFAQVGYGKNTWATCISQMERMLMKKQPIRADYRKQSEPLDHIMASSNQELFEQQLDEVIHHFPQLKRIAASDGDFLKGILDIPNDDGEIIGSYMIEVKNSQGFPYRFPRWKHPK
jgi:hypothetical protein